VARVLLACWGSYGDLFSCVAIAGALTARGHDPVSASARAADGDRRVDAARGAEAAAGVIERTLERA
jgi:UDP:flavonoid glycosyltransferase YjiC (YdhE family)